MLKKALGIFFFFAILTSCGNDEITQEECSACNESELNAPVAEIIEKSFSPDGKRFDFPPYKESWGMRKNLYDKLSSYYSKASWIINGRFVALIDFSQHSSKKRFYLFDLQTNNIEMHLTSHGLASDPGNDGFAHIFSNTINSKQTSLGAYLTTNSYFGRNGQSLRLKGMSDTNSNAEKRMIVIHPAKYINEKMSRAGRSWGCPALDPIYANSIIQKLKGGALVLMDK